VSAVPARQQQVAVQRPAVRAIAPARHLPRARTLFAASLVLCGLAVLLAALAGESAMAFWASTSVVPLVSPVAYAYVLELAIMHGVWSPFVVETVSMAFLLAALGRSVALLDEL
jgi:hypothetical protein